jgi:ankyrin repeat protein
MGGEASLPLPDPALWTAVEPEEVRQLLADGADVEERGGPMKTSPLHQAALVGGEAVARLLLEHGADVSVKDRFGFTPLHWAAVVGGEAVTRLLLEHGADVSSKNNSGGTPLHLDARSGNQAVALLLLQAGANVSATDTAGDTPEDIATAASHLELAAMLEEEAVSRAKCVAFAMGQHARLGAVSWVQKLDARWFGWLGGQGGASFIGVRAGSWVHELDPGVVRMIVEQV